ncbi:hypothetical protein HMPREF1521_1535 [Veillonella sp. AS16]|nr:hypothetical protein HMPREF1521_1535 [Veillonella sp. AS16]
MCLCLVDDIERVYDWLIMLKAFMVGEYEFDEKDERTKCE